MATVGSATTLPLSSSTPIRIQGIKDALHSAGLDGHYKVGYNGTASMHLHKGLVSTIIYELNELVKRSATKGGTCFLNVTFPHDAVSPEFSIADDNVLFSKADKMYDGL